MRTLIIGLLSAAAFTVQADDAKQILQDRLQSLRSFQASFTQQVKDVSGELVHEAEGTLSVTRPSQLYWHTVFPDEVLLVADGKSVWQVDYFVEQVTVLDQDSAIENNPMMLMTSSDPTLWDKYSVQNDDNTFVVTANTQGPITTLRFEFDAQQLVAIASTDAQQQTSYLLFANQVVNSPMPDGLFTVDLPEGFVLDDQRQQP